MKLAVAIARLERINASSLYPFGPRVLPILSIIITDEDFEMVKIDLFNLMLAKTKLKRSKDGPTHSEASASEFPVATPITQTNSKHCKINQMFRGLNTKPQTNKNSNASEEDDDEVLRYYCKAELNLNMRDATDGACPAHNEDDNSINASKYTSVADLAGVFLAIPISSASSERIWTRGASALSLRRAGAILKDS
jgi:hypothetical protein